MFVALSLAGCVASRSPVLTGASPEFGQRGQLHAFTAFIGGSDEGVDDLGSIAFQ
jgi:hypothetical protein